MINTRYWRHARVKCSLYSPSASRTRTNLTPVGLIFPSRHAHAHTHTRASARASAYTKDRWGGSREAISLPVAAKSTRKLAILDGTQPLVFTDRSEQNNSIHTSNFCSAVPFRPWWERRKERRAFTGIGLRVEGSTVSSARLKIGKGWSRRRGASNLLEDNRSIKERRRLFVQRNVTKM